MAYTVTYVPDTGLWHWEVRRVIERVFDGDAESMEKAIKQAQRTIDTVVDA